MDFIIIIVCSILSVASIVVGGFGLIQVKLCPTNRIKPALVSVQVTAILLAVVMSLLTLQYFVYLDLAVMSYLLLNSTFLLLVQVVALMAAMPRPERTADQIYPKRRIRVAS